MLPRKTISPILCVMLAIGAAWPAPIAPRGAGAPPEPPMAGVGRPAVATILPASRPFDRDDHAGLAPVPSEFDDVEDSDDLVALKRSLPGYLAGGWGFHGWPAGGAVAAPSVGVGDPMATRPRTIALRC